MYKIPPWGGGGGVYSQLKAYDQHSSQVYFNRTSMRFYKKLGLKIVMF